MKKLAFTLIVLLMGCSMQAQINLDHKSWETGIHENMLLTNLTFSLGNNGTEWKYYVYTSAEWMLTDHFGIEGGAFFNVGSTEMDAVDLLTGCCAINDGQADYYTHNLFFGPNYHFFTRKSIDLYAGFHPGLTLFYAPDFSYQRSGETNLSPSHTAVTPAGSALAGVAYYAKFFHVFGQARYVMSRYDSQQFQAQLNDFRLAFGLGFNLF